MGEVRSGPDPEAVGTRRGGSLALRGLTKVYGAETVVDRFDAVVAAGEFFSLLGPSGSGKTTTLMMIAGFAPIDAGELVVDGRDMSAVPPEKRGFGMVFQNYAIFPHLDVFENVAFPLRARGMPKDAVGERVAWALGLVQLGHLGDRFARQLSGGQQQRVAIARAIVFHPGIVLMDEPLGALDKNLRYDMQVEIKDIQQRLGMTVVYVTHDQEEAMNLSDRMAIMNRGRVEQIGAPSDVYEHPVNTFTAKFLGEANLLDGIVAAAEPGGAKIRLSGGQVLQVGRAHKLGSASPARLFVRPEKLALLPPESTEGDANRLAGRVHRASFLGNIVRYAVEIEGGGTMLADAPNLSRGFRPAVGEAVTVTWSPADSSLLDPDA
jgi:spermidine/putrescine ABC transporter ATP-binding subunit